MANTEQLERAEARRAARKARQEQARRDADAQDQEQIGATQRQAAARAAAQTDEGADARVSALEDRPKAKPPVDKRAQIVQRRKLAELQAEKDARVKAIDHADAPHVPGKVPPLHVQNARARRFDAEQRDAAKAAAQAAGRATMDVLMGKRRRDTHTRFKRVRQAQAEFAAMQEIGKETGADA